jgi:hypothetical protein
MILMNRFRRSLGLRTRLTADWTIWPTLLALLCMVGCERPAAVQTADAAPAEQHQVPFHAAPGASDARPDDPQGSQDNIPTGLPFQDAQSLPAGTLLTVRLKSPISAENPGAKGTFEAVIDEPVVIEGNKLVPRGVSVAGRVESAQTSSVRHNRGYVRLALDSIHLAGANLTVQTSSLFVKGTAAGLPTPRENSRGEVPPNQPPAGVIRLEKGRRLTFRLTEPVYVAASQRTQTDR